MARASGVTVSPKCPVAWRVFPHRGTGPSEWHLGGRGQDKDLKIVACPLSRGLVAVAFGYG
jgi:hypothetical protein